jgi:hypothetical protein
MRIWWLWNTYLRFPLRDVHLNNKVTKILNGGNLALRVLTCGSRKWNIKWGFHCNGQTEAAPLAVNLPTTYPIITFPCDTYLCCRNSERCLPMFSLFRSNTMTLLEQWLLHWNPPNSCQQEQTSFRQCLSLLVALQQQFIMACRKSFQNLNVSIQGMGPLYSKDNKYFSTSGTFCYEFSI